MHRRNLARVAAVAFSAGLAVTLIPAGAHANPGFATNNAEPGTVKLAPPEMVAALERDLDLTAAEASDLLTSDLAASDLDATLSVSLGNTYGGGWVDGDRLVVAITDPARAAEVRAAGAQPKLVTHSEATLDSAIADLNGVTAPDAADVYGWHVDVMTNSVVVQAAPGAADTAAAWVEESGIDAALVRVETSTEKPELLYDIIGGYPYYFGAGSRCSVGFSVLPRGFVTAGHCGGVGTQVRGFNNAAKGVVSGSIFPGRDMGYVAANTSWTPRPWVYRWDNSAWIVIGSQEAAINAATCRSGSTTGYRCGTITHKNQTVNYAQGAVHGLTRTTACAQPGDSGGSFIASGIHAQGVTSGGSGNCSWGGITFFQPVNPILSTWGLTLVTG